MNIVVHGIVEQDCVVFKEVGIMEYNMVSGLWICEITGCMKIEEIEGGIKIDVGLEDGDIGEIIMSREGYTNIEIG